MVASPRCLFRSVAAAGRRSAKPANDLAHSRTASVFALGISVLMRGRGMKRCLAEGAERFELFVGAAVLANNLLKIGELLIKRAKRRVKRTNR